MVCKLNIDTKGKTIREIAPEWCHKSCWLHHMSSWVTECDVVHNTICSWRRGQWVLKTTRTMMATPSAALGAENNNDNDGDTTCRCRGRGWGQQHHLQLQVAILPTVTTNNATRRFLPPCCVVCSIFEATRRCWPPRCVIIHIFDTTRRFVPPHCVVPPIFDTTKRFVPLRCVVPPIFDMMRRCWPPCCVVPSVFDTTTSPSHFLSLIL